MPVLTKPQKDLLSSLNPKGRQVIIDFVAECVREARDERETVLSHLARHKFEDVVRAQAKLEGARHVLSKLTEELKSAH